MKRQMFHCKTSESGNILYMISIRHKYMLDVVSAGDQTTAKLTDPFVDVYLHAAGHKINLSLTPRLTINVA